MDFHLEKQIRLNDQTGHNNLYSWCLEEINSEGKKVGSNYIPWEWSFNFTASELCLNQGFKFEELFLFDDDEKEDVVDKEKKLEDSEVITAILHSGICIDGRQLEKEARFSMFGTDRAITDFSLRIYKIGNELKERCNIWGGISYTSEIDFRNETSPDSIEIQLGLSEIRFNKLANLISTKEIDVVRINLGRVSGFYSEWSPSISTNRVKVLARVREHEINTPDGCDISPPRLGGIGKFDLTFITRHKLNLKQDSTALNISKLFGDDEFYEEETEVQGVEVEDPTRQLLARIAQNQIEIIKLKAPLWTITFLLGALALSVWF